MYTLLLIGVRRPLLLAVGGVEAEADLEMEEEVVVAIIMMYMLVLIHSPALVRP